ncbi:UDP-2,4-diacetamido-2,4,6-trideoxy-beta-L-altropyranose hydrolase [Trinickia symbiotica]|uniref:UDP-2,4-diacetamido-2,4, 6-trideoxy-beta-L-altropyranose hydrolase n=1 Tax=Trinickia symbiotica TaxID=863227 RepID=A0A2T3XNJ0_9BURK|nr:UDP-2,4-diacetamido-2,4,6-trideoxy-beta-L-altropyranose hydrolase [Trinickia symbiotica]PTB18083.1 UDP-2,4-diacetamido-2,4,6-trideoxy-beta-L-altropyranose hydrolase [Trinickia symbiotica]
MSTPRATRGAGASRTAAGIRIAIRADASISIGSGHIMRCLALADGLRAEGAEPQFITRAHDGNLDALIEARGYRVHSLRGDVGVTRSEHVASGEPPHAVLLGCDWHRDLADTARVLESIGGVDWLVIDHYALDARWHEPVRKFADRLFVIDDLADRDHDADLLLDQNLVEHSQQRYHSRTGPGCERLLGARYALLRPEFAALRKRAKLHVIEGKPRLLVFFGGVDATDETGKFLDAWSGNEAARFVADVVIGARHPRRSLHEQCRRPGVTVHGYVPAMAELMAGADYAFGASGTSNWERFCLGVNAAVVSIAHNQTAIARYLGEQGWFDSLGDARDTTPETYRRALLTLDPASPAALARRERLMQAVDGLGVQRVVRRMLGKPEAL